MFPHFPNQEPPRPQQVDLPDVRVPHLGHPESTGAVTGVKVTALVIGVAVVSVVTTVVIVVGFLSVEVTVLVTGVEVISVHV